MAIVARKLGLLLSTAPSHASVETVVQLSQAALRRGVEVYLYLIDEGVKVATVVVAAVGFYVETHCCGDFRRSLCHGSSC